MKNLTTSSSKLGKTNVFREATLIALLLLTPLCCQAQNNIGKRHEFYFGVGMLNLLLQDHYDEKTKDIPYNAESECFAIPVNLSFDYKYRLTKRFSVGAALGFTNETNDDYYDYHAGNAVESPEEKGYYKSYMMFAMPEISYTWFISDNGIFRAYSGAGLGLALFKDKSTVPLFECNKTRTDLAYNLTFAGMAIGGERIKFFGEFNGGCKGMLTAGMVVRF